jgi:hypothetical protein
MGLLLIFSHPLLRKPSYELFIRMHQSLAVFSAYAIWRHLALQPLAPRLYIYILAGTFLLTLLLQCLFRLTPSRASITHSNGIVKIHLKFSQPLKVLAGQYICLWIPWIPWIPAASFWSFLQSHPFVVTSWSEGEQSSLDLFVKPCGGLTWGLLRHGKIFSDDSSTCPALFSGPHGISAPVGDYETILMAASGPGIAAELAYLKQLTYEYNSRKNRTRRVHLVWQVQTSSKLQ